VFKGDAKQAVGQASISQPQVAGLEIALPPVPEQHRIVAKVDALMALCARLEASLTATAATRRRLLDALLHEALAPVESDNAHFNKEVMAHDKLPAAT
jgi:type I restriction enzyme S subunit